MKNKRIFNCAGFILFIGAYLQAYAPSHEETIANRKHLEELTSPHCIAIPEGSFVYYSHPMLTPWLQNEINVEVVKDIRKQLGSYLKIPFSKEGFTVASTRWGEDEIDTTNYSAVWVRDCCWHYYGLKIIDRAGARQLMLNLLSYYSSKEQKRRFFAVIQTPEIADPASNPSAKMDVPLIRFSSKTLSHVQVDRKDQTWDHLQFDSHGLFLLA